MNTQNKANIMVFGIDGVVDYRPPDKPLELNNCILHFKYFETEDKFQDYDGVILFQGTFEHPYHGEIARKKELAKRENQFRQLLEKGGYCCFLLVTPFIDYAGKRDISGTDLAKRILNYWELPNIFYKEQITDLRIVRDEFRPFLKDFGSAQTGFQIDNAELNLRPICFAGHDLTGFVLNNSIFFIPCLLPGKREKEFREYFSLLADALISSFKKLTQELPTWTEEYIFNEEKKLLAEKDSISKRIDEINQRLAVFSEYKKCLCYDDELLKESVISILQNGFKFHVDAEDQLKEDLKILDHDKKPMIFVEVKGTNKGISREFINQADSHREHSGFSSDFPSILIVNTNIKNAKSLEDKYQEIAKEQINHAVTMEILVLRTIDFLNLLYLSEAGKVTPEQVLEIFKKEYGWLKATQEEYKIDKGQE